MPVYVIYALASHQFEVLSHTRDRVTDLVALVDVDDASAALESSAANEEGSSERTS